MSSPHYNHPFWPSPRAARIAKMLLKKPGGRLTHDKALKVMADQLGLTVHQFLHIQPVDAILRLKLADTEQKAWSILGNTTLPPWWQWQGKMPCCYVCERTAPAPPAAATVVPVRDPPAPAIMPALSAAGLRPHPTTDIYKDDPCTCRVLGRTCECEHDAATLQRMVPTPVPVPVPVPVPASDELIETLMEFLKEMNGMVTTGDQRYVTALVQQFKGRVV